MSFAKKSFSIFTRDIFLFILSVFTSVVIARKLGPELLGVWVVIFLIPAYAEAFGRLKFDLAAVYFLGKKKYSENEILYHLNLVALVTGLLITTILLLFTNTLNQFLFDGDPGKIILILAILPNIILNFLDLNYTYLLISREDVKTYNNMVIIKAIISSGGASLLLLLFNYGIWSVIATSVLSTLFSLIYGSHIFNKKIIKTELTNKINKQLLKDFFNYSYKIYIGGLISFFNVYLMKSFLSVMLNSSKVAFFSIAQDRASLLEKIPSAVNVLLYPKVSNSSHEDSSKITSRAFRIILILCFYSSLTASFFVKPIILILYGEAYLPVVVPLLLIIPGIIFSGTSSVFTSYFTGIGRADVVMKLSIFPLILQLSLGFILITNFDIIGAALTFTFSMILFGIIQALIFTKISKNSIKDLTPLYEDYLYIFAFIKLKILNR